MEAFESLYAPKRAGFYPIFRKVGKGLLASCSILLSSSALFAESLTLKGEDGVFLLKVESGQSVNTVFDWDPSWEALRVEDFILSWKELQAGQSQLKVEGAEAFDRSVAMIFSIPVVVSSIEVSSEFEIILSFDGYNKLELFAEGAPLALKNISEADALEIEPVLKEPSEEIVQSLTVALEAVEPEPDSGEKPTLTITPAQPGDSMQAKLTASLELAKKQNPPPVNRPIVSVEDEAPSEPVMYSRPSYDPELHPKIWEERAAKAEAENAE